MERETLEVEAETSSGLDPGSESLDLSAATAEYHALSPALPWLLEKSRSPWVSTGFTLAALWAGIIGALYAPELLRTFPFDLLGTLQTWVIVFSFWFFVALAGLLFYLRQSAVDRVRLNSESRLDKTADGLMHAVRQVREMVRTLPPADFLERFQKNYAACEAVVEKLPALTAAEYTEKHLASVEAAIRLVLNGIATLAAQFSTLGTGPVYGANVMVYRSLDSSGELQRQRFESETRFRDLDSGAEQWRGVLELDSALSTATDGTEGAVDRLYKSKCFCLPIPKTPLGRTGKSRVLPGAPDAYLNKIPEHYPNLSRLYDELDARDLSPSLVLEVKEYFKNSRIRSFASINLPHHAGDPIGILNIDCSAESLLRATESGPHFFNLLPPFESLLLRLIGLREKIGASLPHVIATQPSGSTVGRGEGSSSVGHGHEQPFAPSPMEPA